MMEFTEITSYKDILPRYLLIKGKLKAKTVVLDNPLPYWLEEGTKTQWGILAADAETGAIVITVYDTESC